MKVLNENIELKEIYKKTFMEFYLQRNFKPVYKTKKSLIFGHTVLDYTVKKETKIERITVNVVFKNGALFGK